MKHVLLLLHKHKFSLPHHYLAAHRELHFPAHQGTRKIVTNATTSANTANNTYLSFASFWPLTLVPLVLPLSQIDTVSAVTRSVKCLIVVTHATKD
jgi:hypothetical protein